MKTVEVNITLEFVEHVNIDDTCIVSIYSSLKLSERYELTTDTVVAEDNYDSGHNRQYGGDY